MQSPSQTSEAVTVKNKQAKTPLSVRKELLEKIHDGHLGMEKCKRRAGEVLFWPQMSQQIQDYVSKCEMCLTN